MKRLRCVACILAMVACSRQNASTPAPAPERAAGFVDRVWSLVESPGGGGELYVFLSDGTFVRAAKEARPDIGKWSWDGKRITYTQDALPYEADIDSLTDSYFRITVHFMEQSFVLGLVPATASMPDTTRTVEFDPASSRINVWGNNPTWLFSIENDRATLRMDRKSVSFTGGEWVRDCAAVWGYTATARHDGIEETIEMELSTSNCVDSTSGATSPLTAHLVRDGKEYWGCAVAGKLP